MKQKVLVTGANGYIGKNVISYLLNNNIVMKYFQIIQLVYLILCAIYHNYS